MTGNKKCYRLSQGYQGHIVPVVMHEHDQDAHLEHLGAVEQHLGPHHQQGVIPPLAALCARVRQDPVRWTAPRTR